MVTIQISEELLAELQEKAATEGKTVDELAGEALKKGLEERTWHDLLEYGGRRGQESGYTEEDTPEVVRQWRREQHSR